MRRQPAQAGQSAQHEYVRRRRAWRLRALAGLPLAAVAAAAAWWIGWHTLTAPALGAAAGVLVLAAYTAAIVRPPAHVTAWRSGAVGEQATARLLRPLARQGAVVLHDRAVPRSKANIDHLTIGPRTVAAVDSKQWQMHGARVVLGRDGTLWYGNPKGQQYPQARTVATVQWAARRAAEELTRATGRAVTVIPVMAIHGATVARRGHLVVNGVHVVQARRLRRLLRRLPGTLTTEDIRRLAEAAERALPTAH